MASTLTSFYSFSAGTKARASEINTNFSAVRGDFIPISSSTATSSTNTYDLGKSDRRWKDIYGGTLDLRGMTSTTDAKFVPSTSVTAGSLDLRFGSTTVGSWDSTGYIGPYGTGSIQQAALGFTLPAMQEDLAGDWTATANTPWIIVEACGGGGGGGGGSSNNAGNGAGGGGGSGSVPYTIIIRALSSGTVISRSAGTGGAGGAGGTYGNPGTAGSTGTSSTVSVSGGATYTWKGGEPGAGGTLAPAGGAGGVHQASGGANGGDGGGSGAAGSAGWGSPWGSGGAGGSTASGQGGGGGGGAGGGSGGAGGGGKLSGGTNGTAGTNGGGGGGGGGTASVGFSGGTGGNGDNGFVRFYFIEQ